MTTVMPTEDDPPARPIHDPRIEILNPPPLGPAVGFAHVARAGGWVWLGGQIGCDETGRVVSPGDMAAQFDRAIRNVEIALRAAGCRPQDAVKFTYYVTDVSAYRAALGPIGASYREVFGRHFPATSLFEVKGLFNPEAMLEIECVALAPDATP
jgi:enamine deaminase RidA (YjgF/YER057c/UK114 family)